MKNLETKILAVLALLGIVALPAVALAADAKVVTPLNGTNLEGWQTKGDIEQSTWTVGAPKLDPDNPAGLVVEPAPEGQGALVTPTGRGQDIFTVEKFGDCTVDLEVLVSKGSNSGIYMMGEYEVQVLDSFGREQVGPGDMGGIYGATAPAVNASKAPGEWQRFVIEFQAPRFEGDTKVANAKFLKVTLNGQVIHENVEMARQTPGGVTGSEHPAGPLMFQGNHGPVAYRNIRVTVKE